MRIFVRPFTELSGPTFRCTAPDTRSGIARRYDLRSFGGHWLCAAGSRLLLVSEQPALQPVEIDVNDRRRIEREDLRHRESTDDGVTERLADFRADPRTHHHRDSAEQCRHRGHHDRAKA